MSGRLRGSCDAHARRCLTTMLPPSSTRSSTAADPNDIESTARWVGSSNSCSYPNGGSKRAVSATTSGCRCIHKSLKSCTGCKNLRLTSPPYQEHLHQNCKSCLELQCRFKLPTKLRSTATAMATPDPRPVSPSLYLFHRGVPKTYRITFTDSLHVLRLPCLPSLCFPAPPLGVYALSSLASDRAPTLIAPIGQPPEPSFQIPSLFHHSITPKYATSGTHPTKQKRQTLYCCLLPRIRIRSKPRPWIFPLRSARDALGQCSFWRGTRKGPFRIHRRVRRANDDLISTPFLPSPLPCLVCLQRAFTCHTTTTTKFQTALLLVPPPPSRPRERPQRAIDFFESMEIYPGAFQTLSPRPPPKQIPLTCFFR